MPHPKPSGNHYQISTPREQHVTRKAMKLLQRCSLETKDCRTPGSDLCSTTTRAKRVTSAMDEAVHRTPGRDSKPCSSGRASPAQMRTEDRNRQENSADSCNSRQFRGLRLRQVHASRTRIPAVASTTDALIPCACRTTRSKDSSVSFHSTS